MAQIGDKNTCLNCGEKIILYQCEFWKDTGTLVPKGPQYPRWTRESESDGSFERKSKAFKEWENELRTRQVIRLGKGWYHLIGATISTVKDLERFCGGKKELGQPEARPANMCWEVKGDGTRCGKAFKEIVGEGVSKRALCGIHLHRIARIVTQNEEETQRMELDRWKKENLEEKVRKLNEYGIEAKTIWIYHTRGPVSGSYSDKVQVDPDKLLELLSSSIELMK